MASRLLEVPLKNQTLDLWCWAAIASAVSAYFQQYLPFLEPCQVATRVGGPVDCCSDPTQCNFRAGLDEALKAIGLTKARTVDPLPFDQIADQVINHQFPVGARLTGPGVDGHFVLIVGCDDVSKIVTVADPSGAPGLPSWRGPMLYDTLLSNYGSWNGCCTNSVVID